MSRKLQRGFFRLALGFFLWLCVLSLLPKTSFAECGNCGPDYPGSRCDTCCPVGDNTCTQSCNQIAEKCSWTNHNSCQPDQWGPWGICNDHCQVRYCEPPGDTRDMELRSCGGGTCGSSPPGYMPAWAGYYDSQFGDQTSASCTANGWITDLNRPDRDIWIRFYVDDMGDPINKINGDWIYASNSRADLLTVCLEGTCAFDVNLWDIQRSDGTYPLRDENEHIVLVYSGAGHLIPYSSPPATGFWRKIKCVDAPTPTPTPFPCTSGFNVSCAGSGTQATISWDPIAVAVGYVLRLNHEPYDAPANWYNAAQGDQWQEPVSSTINVAITPGANYQYDVQGKKPGEGSPYK